MQNDNENIQKLGRLIKGINVAMMTTTDTDGTLRSRPMATQQVDFDGELWFFTGKSSHKMTEIDQDHRVNLSYADAGKNTFVSVSGTARISPDRAKIKELWNPLLLAWFPKGMDDPDVALLKVTPTQAEYWDAANSKLVTLVGFVKALLTGEPARPGDHGKVSL